MLALIPQPKEMTMQAGKIALTDINTLQYPPRLEKLAQFGQQNLAAEWGWKLTLKPTSKPNIAQSSNHTLSLELDSKLEPEEYQLLVDPTNFRIMGGTDKGVFYGLQTLRQILFQQHISMASNVTATLPQSIPAVQIRDSPRFSWRGFMLDEGRFFLGKATVKKVLDWMAFYKFNRLHWHLTEDQGWRIEIKKYPNLTAIGATRKGTPKFRNKDEGHDGIIHSGFYTQTEIQELIAYAADRCIEIIPEIELPGHAMAALAAYPELGCSGGPYEVSTKWGVHKDVFCLGNDKTLTFMKDIISEVCALFPSPWIHLGGDEVPKDRWNMCPKCQAKIQAEHLTDAHHLQVFFTNQMVQFLTEKGKQCICWNEVTDARLDNKTISQYWKGHFEAIKQFLSGGGRTIISPSHQYYVDIAYSFLPLKKCYTYEPVPITTSPDIAKQILGIETEMWGEVFQSEKKLEWCTFPRTLAIAETAWTFPQRKDYAEFKTRVANHLKILDVFQIHHASLPESDPSFWQTLKVRIKPWLHYYA